jgi:hypothetical protein
VTTPRVQRVATFADSQQAQVEIRRARRETEKLRARIRRLEDAGQNRAARQLQHRLMTLKAAKVAAAAEANRPAKRNAQTAAAAVANANRHRPLSPEQVLKTAPTISMWREDEHFEPVRVYAEPKKSGGCRPLHKMGVRNKARSILA